MLKCYLDTNVLIHYKKFNTLDWHSILETQEDILLIIAPIVLRELDEKKDSDQNDKIRNRCREIIKTLNKYFYNNKINEGIFLKMIPIEPQIDWRENGLSPDVNDDRIIASMLLEEDVSNLILVSSDLGIKLKANHKGLKTVEIDDSFKEQVRLDSDKKKIQELGKKIERFENASPKLNLYVKSSPDQNFFEYELQKALVIDSVTIEMEIEKLRKELEYVPIQESSNIFRAGIFSGLRISEEEIKRYQNELDEYLNKMRGYYRYKNNYENFRTRLFHLPLVLANIGEKVALDIDIFLHFPDGFKILSKKETLKYREPNAPEKPVPPRSAIEILTSSSNELYPYYFHSPMPNLNNLKQMELGVDYSLVSIEKTNSHDVHFQVKKLKQNMDMELDYLYLLFNSYEEIKSFSFDYKINVENHPDQFNGTYHIKFKPVG